MTHFNRRFTGPSGIVTLMEDLGDALNQNPDMIFMGGGNPAAIPEVESCLAEHLRAIADSPERLHKLIGEYQPPQGDPLFREQLSVFLSDTYGWPITADHLAISNGGQSAFFTLFNMLAGRGSDSASKKILLPLLPDYLGYADTGLDAAMFQGLAPKIECNGDHWFKYSIDFDQIALDDSIAAVCLSRPANPSGNVVTDYEIDHLIHLCEKHNTRLVIDSAYGSPFPGLIFCEHKPVWHQQVIHILSLSKLGLPGARTGIVIAEPSLIKRFSRATASLSLAPGNLGPSLANSLLATGDLMRLSTHVIQPYYQHKLEQTIEYILPKISALPIRLHKAEGGFFLWLWFEGLPISSQQLYEQLKAQGVLIVSGHHFFKPLNNDAWAHQHECVRLSYAGPWGRIKEGIDQIIEMVSELYGQTR